MHLFSSNKRKQLLFQRAFFIGHKVFIQNIVANVKKFLTAAETKKISFLQHYQQTGGSANAQNNLPISVLKRGPVTYFSINYS